MEIITDDKTLYDLGWTDFVKTHPQGSFFQGPEAYYFFKTCDGFEPWVIGIKNNLELIGLMTGILVDSKTIKGFFSRRTVIWGGPLLKNSDSALLEAMLKALDYGIADQSIYTEFRNLGDLSVFREKFKEFQYHYKPHLNIHVPVTSGIDPIALINKGKQRQIRSSLRSGAKIIHPRSLEDVQQFYWILRQLYRRKVKKPLPDFNFFKSFYLNENLGQYFLIEYKERIIGGIMCPVFENRVIYEWYVGGLDREFKGVHPSVLATWAAIKYAFEHDYEYFDFLGAGSPKESYGVRNFKQQFGGDIFESGRFIKINKPLYYALGKLVLRITEIIS